MAAKHLQLRAALMQEMESRQLKPGTRLPSEAALVKQWGVSRITVSRALNDLQNAGLIDRRAGSGSYVKVSPGRDALSFGLLIPDLGETDIFEPICQGIMSSPSAQTHALLWGHTSGLPKTPKEVRAWQLCEQYIERRVSGVFFAPVETGPSHQQLNARIARALQEAKIPIVLLDRSALPYPQQSDCDLVGIDNRTAGFVVTQHLIACGARRLAFVGSQEGAATIDAREAGYRDALFASGLSIERTLIYRGETENSLALNTFFSELAPDGVTCANDRTAGRVMHALRRQGRRVPEDVRLVGVDDVEYAALLPVPLTTYRQPTAELGDVAITVMLERIARPDLPARETLLKGGLVVRESCGSGRDGQ